MSTTVYYYSYIYIIIIITKLVCILSGSQWVLEDKFELQDVVTPPSGESGTLGEADISYLSRVTAHVRSSNRLASALSSEDISQPPSSPGFSMDAINSINSNYSTVLYLNSCIIYGRFFL